MSEGSIYIAGNQYMPELIKIGMTRRSIWRRLEEFHTTNSPCEWSCWYDFKTENADEVEKKIHKHFEKFRVSKNREFFKIDADDAWGEILKICDVKRKG